MQFLLNKANLGIYLLCIILLSGCASKKVSDFSRAQISDSKVGVFGRVHVLYNKKDYTDKCSICFDNNMCQDLQKNGLVLVNIESGVGKINKVICDNYHQNLYGQIFSAKKREGKLLYFGDIEVIWEDSSEVGLKKQASIKNKSSAIYNAGIFGGIAGMISAKSSSNMSDKHCDKSTLKVNLYDSMNKTYNEIESKFSDKILGLEPYKSLIRTGMNSTIYSQ